MGKGVIGVGEFAAVAVPHPGHLAVVVVFELLIGAIRIGDLGHITSIIVFVLGSIPFTVSFTDSLIQLIIRNVLRAVVVDAFDDSAIFIIDNGQEVAVFTGTGILSAILIIGESERPLLGNVLLCNTALRIILIGEIDLVLEVLDRLQQAAAVRIEQTVGVGVHSCSQVCVVIGQATIRRRS